MDGVPPCAARCPEGSPPERGGGGGGALAASAYPPAFSPARRPRCALLSQPPRVSRCPGLSLTHSLLPSTRTTPPSRTLVPAWPPPRGPPPLVSLEHRVLRRLCPWPFLLSLQSPGPAPLTPVSLSHLPPCPRPGLHRLCGPPFQSSSAPAVHTHTRPSPSPLCPAVPFTWTSPLRAH